MPLHVKEEPIGPHRACAIPAGVIIAESYPKPLIASHEYCPSVYAKKSMTFSENVFATLKYSYTTSELEIFVLCIDGPSMAAFAQLVMNS
jgi:hypothetical protein